jgi:plastocyanin
MKRLSWIASLLIGASAGLGAVEYQVNLTHGSFEPAHLTIEVGDTVRWSNQSGHPHNVRADDGSFRCAVGCSSSGGLTSSRPTYDHPEPQNPGDPSDQAWSFTLTFDEPGEYPYHCEVHGAPGGIGMAGTVIVLDAGDNGDNGDPPGFAINFGLTGSWFNPETGGQGFLFDVLPDGPEGPSLVVYWFAYSDQVGGPEEQRWFVAQGGYSPGDDTVQLEILMVTGGVFDQPDPVDLNVIGVAELVFEDCMNATLTYDIDLDDDPGANMSGSIPVTRLSPDVMCEELNATD